VTARCAPNQRGGKKQGQVQDWRNEASFGLGFSFDCFFNHLTFCAMPTRHLLSFAMSMVPNVTIMSTPDLPTLSTEGKCTVNLLFTNPSGRGAEGRN
jgi:hypothetical protein